MDERTLVRVLICGGFGSTGWIATHGYPIILAWSWPLLGVAVLCELATTYHWSGFWGEKNEDGTPKYPG